MHFASTRECSVCIRKICLAPLKHEKDLLLLSHWLYSWLKDYAPSVCTPSAKINPLCALIFSRLLASITIN